MIFLYLKNILVYVNIGYIQTLSAQLKATIKVKIETWLELYNT